MAIPHTMQCFLSKNVFDYSSNQIYKFVTGNRGSMIMENLQLPYSEVTLVNISVYALLENKQRDQATHDVFPTKQDTVIINSVIA